MVFLLLAILSSTMISVIMRLSSDKIKNNLSMLAVNYLICSLLSAVYAGFPPVTPHAPGFPTAAVLGVVNGILLLAGFVLLQVNTRKNGIVLSSVFMKLGLLVPMILSVVYFGEIPNGLQIAGFCIALGAIVLINLKKGIQLHDLKFGLILLLLAGGSVDAMSKVYESIGSAVLSNQFLLVSFGVAFLLCAGLVILKKERPDPQTFLFGVLIGIPNFFSSKFLLGALGEISAVVVYPSFSVAAMLLVTLSGVVVFKEQLDRRQWIALGAIIVSLVLLNL